MHARRLSELVLLDSAGMGTPFSSIGGSSIRWAHRSRPRMRRPVSVETCALLLEDSKPAWIRLGAAHDLAVLIATTPPTPTLCEALDFFPLLPLLSRLSDDIASLQAARECSDSMAALARELCDTAGPQTPTHPAATLC